MQHQRLDLPAADAERDARVAVAVEEIGFGFGKDRHRFLVGQLRQQVVAIAGDGDSEAGLLLVLADVALKRRLGQRGGRTGSGVDPDIRRNAVGAPAEPLLLEDQVIHFPRVLADAEPDAKA